MTSLTERVGLHHLPWMEEALCTTADPEIWYPGTEHDLGRHAIVRNTRTAKSLCWDCPVRRKCYDYAVENDERFGIWGGHDFGK